MAQDFKKIRDQLYEKAMREAKNDEGEAVDNFMTDAAEFAKKLPFAEKVEFAKANSAKILEAYEASGMSPDAKVEDLLTEVIFHELS